MFLKTVLPGRPGITVFFCVVHIFRDAGLRRHDGWGGKRIHPSGGANTGVACGRPHRNDEAERTKILEQNFTP